MSITVHSRQSSITEVVAEMDRRGAVIESLEAEIERLNALVRLPDVERRQLFISQRLKVAGYFNRSDICGMFAISIPQASLDIRRWLSNHGQSVTYNTSAKRYEASNG